MKQFACFLSISLLVIFLSSCDKDEAEEVEVVKTYLDYPNFNKEGLVAYYPLNGDVKDYSGNNHDATLYGATSVSDRFNAENGAYTFDGEDDYIEISNSPKFNGLTGTICLWVRVPHLAVPGDEELYHRAILSKGSASKGGFVIQKGYGRISVIAYPDKGRIEAKMGLPEASYFFIAILFNENTLNSYRDGEVVDANTFIPEWLFNNNEQNLYIGKSPVDDPEFNAYKNFKGEIDDVLIYDRILSSIEIERLADWKKGK